MAAISAGSGSGHGGASDSVFVWQLSLLGPGLVTEERLIQCLCVAAISAGSGSGHGGASDSVFVYGSCLSWVRVWSRRSV